jgi:hypothetical protein
MQEKLFCTVTWFAHHAGRFPINKEPHLPNKQQLSSNWQKEQSAEF